MKHKYRTRVQGESLQKKIADLEFKIIETIWYPTCFFVITIWAWLFCAGLIKLDFAATITITGVTLYLVIRSILKIKKIRKQLHFYRKGLEGERLVGESLNQLSNESTYVFHDIPSNRFNVEHIIASTHRFIVIETNHFDDSVVKLVTTHIKEIVKIDVD